MIATLDEILVAIEQLEDQRRSCWRGQETGTRGSDDLRAIECQLEELYAQKRWHMRDIGPMGLSRETLRQLRSDHMMAAARHRQARTLAVEQQGYASILRQLFGQGGPGARG